MTVDLTGREYPDVGPYHVGSEDIRNFATAVKNMHPLHHDLEAARAAGHKDLVAPPTYLVTIAQRAEALMVNDPEAEVDFSRVVHADQRFTHHRAVVAGDELFAQATVTSAKELAGNRLLTTATEITNADRAPIATITSTLLIRG
ncbi:MAG: MaoC family dehydratase N-terminal domain-containing protein [Yaniella sp.]|uniref:FAS1-like dehydratase domain-containing protein n=1 Tax=Yaniella sp. TaxID=2773929 RepID=UPI0026471F32|nr:MaoC family dehydratase N-terminal domain-containing protein [Yaniella sp.]MDN5703814.1 MaoC family dehydratase N-terminal domain-containing protein [Yaniella sp.]MDN5732145.1 MaoC family dehydratase N-terminal domain-containing protein [Yaniella sp.]MDN5742749.1 MaoC family dehydratase N-terminal domain-containing protein [Yaniella sp.]MDN5814531.1 MaoC family dehydratase N-terminal domain-containing protein [Yaniella sp.]MDN5816842.1 MaoC family dehydratase N-terminal domain-containing pr